MSAYRPTKPASAEDLAEHGGLTCWEFEAFICDYLDGAISAPARAQFEAHLASCPHCAAYLDDYLRAGRAARRAYAMDAPSDAPAELIEAILKAVRRA